MIDKLVKVYDDFFKGERLKELAQVADTYQMRFSRRAPFSVQHLSIKSFRIFKGEGAKRLLGILSKQAQDFSGLIRFYDYTCTKDLETKTTSIVEVSCEGLDSDYFLIQPKGQLTKFKDFFVSDKRLFPRLSQFHANFEISTKASDAVLPLKEGALRLLIQFPKICVEGEGNRFLFYIRKQAYPAHEIINLLDFAEDFIDLLYFDDEDDFV